MILFAALLGLSLGWVPLQLLVARVMGLRVIAVQLGLGPSVRVSPKVRVGLIPGAFVQFEAVQVAALSFGGFCAINLLPWVLLGLIARVAGAGVEDFVQGFTVLGRVREVFAQWGSWSELLVVSPVVSVARLTARLVAVNLLPLSAVAGGQVIARMIPEPRRPMFHIASMVVLLGVVVFGLFR